MLKRILLFGLVILNVIAVSQTNDTIKTETKKVHWYDKISFRGYMQLRHNRIMVDNKDYASEQSDKNWGNNTNFSIRRMRLILSGQLNEHVYMYFQPDFANAIAGTSTHYVQIRDAYFDYSFDKKKEFRVRFGQSKVPFGFENMQSSQNRLPLDRNDALNSAVSNERDIGAFFYWAPEKVRALYKSLIDDGLKGSGDYGCFAFGAYNGQTANKLEANNGLHLVSRFSYPISIGNQIIEPGIQAYTGKYTLYSDQLTTGVKKNSDLTYKDERAAASFILYPKPFGIQAEYNIGVGPEYDAVKDSITTSPLTGGYITLNYKLNIKSHLIYPYARYIYYEGGKKMEKDARKYLVTEFEAGIEYQPNKNAEIVVAYLNGNRKYSDKSKPANNNVGSLIRVQVQFNF